MKTHGIAALILSGKKPEMRVSHDESDTDFHDSMVEAVKAFRMALNDSNDEAAANALMGAIDCYEAHPHEENEEGEEDGEEEMGSSKY